VSCQGIRCFNYQTKLSRYRLSAGTSHQESSDPCRHLKFVMVRCEANLSLSAFLLTARRYNLVGVTRRKHRAPIPVL